MAYSLSISITQNSQNVANNTSNVTVKVNCSWTYGTWSAENLTKYCTIDGTTHYFNDTDINPNATTSGSSTLFTWTGNISHNSDGTKSLSVYASTKTTNSSGTQTASATKTLTTIPRVSSVTATNAVVGSNSTITISRKSSSFTHTLEYTFGSLSGTIATKTSNTSVAFPLPTSFYAQIGSTATSKSGTIKCTTYSGNTAIGSSTTTFTATTSQATCAPTLSPTIIDTNSVTTGLTGDNNKLIKYYSDVSVSSGAAARNSATIKSQKITNGSNNLTTASGEFNDVENNKFTFSVTDSRGYTTTETVTKTMIDYVKLTCNQNIKITVDGEAHIEIDGNYFNGSFGAYANTLAVQFRYKHLGGEYSNWFTVATTLDGNRYVGTEVLNGLDYQTTYVFQSRAVDRLATKSTEEKNVISLPVFDWGEHDFNFNVPVTVNGDLEVKGSIISKEIVEGTDLNTITDEGNYYCPLNVTAQTLINCPVDVAFTLEVRKTTDSGVSQKIIPYHVSRSGEYLRRTYYDEISDWEYIPSGITYKRGTQYFTSSTSWAYTGAKITIPANCIFGISADFVYSYNAPRGGAFASRSDNVNYIWHEGVGTTYGVAISHTGVTYPSSVQEIYLWAKYAGESSNYVNYTYWYIPLPA